MEDPVTDFSISKALELLDDGTINYEKSILKINLQVRFYQEKIKEIVSGNYSDFASVNASSETQLAEGEKLIKEIENFIDYLENDTINNLQLAENEFNVTADHLKEISIGLKISYKLLRIDELFKNLEKSKSKYEFLDVMNILDKIKTLIMDSKDKVLQHLSCYPNIKIKYHIESELLFHNLQQQFGQLVQFNEKLFQNTKSIIIQIKKDEKELYKIIKALFNMKYNPKSLCEFLLENVFIPITQKPVSIQLTGIEEDSANNEKGQNSGAQNENNDALQFVKLSLSFSLKDLGEDLRPNYKVVFQNIKVVIKCLKYMDIKVNDKLSVLQILGEKIKENLIDMIINECLTYSIPHTIDEMNESTLIDDILEFDKFLKISKILTDSDDCFERYSERVKILFRNRFCSNILENAIEIMKKDLHDMTLITSSFSHTSASKDKCGQSAGADADDTNNDANFDSQHQLQEFPRCMVSKSILELITLMENVLKQISAIPNQEISEHLLSTIPTILIHYMDEVPYFHEKLLSIIPQHTALFHNNCIYLAHWLERNCNKNIQSTDKFVHSLRNLGKEHLANQIKNQQNQLLEILQGFDLSGVTNELGMGPQKVIRQCLRQLDLLKNVWQTILPDSVYNETMCNLLDVFCSEIIKKILVLEDISTAVSDGLVELCSIVIERAPTLFQDIHQVYDVKSWTKFIQMKMILGASLIQITEQWSEGKGPLTINYKAEEIKHLIRALFQNTDRRANALASIV